MKLRTLEGRSDDPFAVDATGWLWRRVDGEQWVPVAVDGVWDDDVSPIEREVARMELVGFSPEPAAIEALLDLVLDGFSRRAEYACIAIDQALCTLRGVHGQVKTEPAHVRADVEKLLDEANGYLTGELAPPRLPVR